MTKRKVSQNSSSKFPLMELFHTLQGEGFHTGKSAVFIRLAGCDVGCIWCDVKESWDANEHPEVSENYIVDQVLSYNTKFAVITGGEPTLYNLTSLVNKLKQNNVYTAIETAGTNHFSDNLDWICFSPKKFKNPKESIYKLADELKVVIYHPSDLEWALEHQKKISNKECQLYIQPEWSKMDTRMPLIINFLKENPKWRLSVQTHKFLNIP